jgi:hypothetical protein
MHCRATWAARARFMRTGRLSFQAAIKAAGPLMLTVCRLDYFEDEHRAAKAVYEQTAPNSIVSP